MFKQCTKFGLLIVVMMVLVFTVSCAKQGPGPDEMETAETGTETAVMPEDQAGDEESTIGEEELEAQRAAEQKAEQERMAAEAKENFQNTKIYFAFDDATLSEQERDKLRQQARWLRDNSDTTVIIEGHTDERGTDEYNLALGSRRAESVKDFMTKLGIDAARLVTISYGEERPVVSASTESAYAQNRRVEFRVR